MNASKAKYLRDKLDSSLFVIIPLSGLFSSPISDVSLVVLDLPTSFKSTFMAFDWTATLLYLDYFSSIHVDSLSQVLNPVQPVLHLIVRKLIMKTPCLCFLLLALLVHVIIRPQTFSFLGWCNMSLGARMTYSFGN